MEIFGPKIKIFLNFFQKKRAFFIFQEVKLSSPKTIPSLKNKKNPLWKNVLYFWKWSFLASRLKSSYIFSNKSFSYIPAGTSKVAKTEIS